jgi:long-chain acyl-CoA synthetase
MFWDKILFSKTKARIGGRVRFILSGSAPLDPKLAEFLKICFCCDVLEGYGLTENSAGASITLMNDTQLGHVGAPLPCCEIKLLDVSEMGYSSSNNPPTGEILLRGYNVFKGYYKAPDQTKEALEADGWFHTGDIGRWNPNGTLSIIDRKKNIFKLAQGEYVAVEYLEGVFIRSKYVLQIWVYGNSYKPKLIAFVVPDPDTVLPWAKENGLPENLESLANNEKLKKAIFDDLTQVGQEAKLHGFEYIKAIHLLAEPFSVDNDCMTPTFKLRRAALTKRFQKEIDTMYEAIED